MVAWAGLEFRVGSPAWVAEVLVRYWLADSVGLEGDGWGSYCWCYRWLIG